MDSVLANSQAHLAHKQRELAKLTEFQLPQNPHLNLGEKHHSHEAEELFKITRDLKNELDNRVPLSDPVAQIQQKKIQLLIAERQYTVAEGQIRIIQGHILSGMDPSRSALSRTSDMKTTDEMQKQAQPLLTEAAELLKKARHSVTFAELGARQRMGNIIREHHQQKQKQQQYRDSHYGRNQDEEEDEVDRAIPEVRPQSPVQQSPPSPPPYSPQPQQDNAPPPVTHYQEEAPRTPVVGAYGNEQQIVYPSEPQVFQKQKKSGGNRCCIIGFIVFVVIALLVGGGIYALYHFDVIQF